MKICGMEPVQFFSRWFLIHFSVCAFVLPAITVGGFCILGLMTLVLMFLAFSEG